MTFKENETYDLESYLGVDKSDHNLEDQIDNLVNEIKLLIDNKNHKKDFIENYNYWVEERIEYEKY
jgi:flagellar biosynthesis chaperone FliJ